MAMPFRSREQVTGVVYYCKDCERIVDAHQVGRKYVYSCNICKTKNVAFGTEKSVRSYFHFDEQPAVVAPAMPAKTEMKPAATAVEPKVEPAVDQQQQQPPLAN